jgi:putative tryptophan/tyrosine transport system substrate-binding protein
MRINHLTRRGFITLLGGAAAWPPSARAQQPAGRMSHIAYLGASSPTRLDPRAMEQFKTGLAENGLVEGRNITVDYFWGEGKRERLQQLAAELAQRDLDVIVTAGPQPLRALIDARTKSPIVFAILNDPISDGFIQNLARPGGNITGLSMAGTDLESKRLELLKDAVPALKKVMILHDLSMGPTGVSEAQAGARALGIESFFVETGDDAKFAEGFASAAAQGIGGVATMASPFLYFHRKRLIALALHYHLPSIWEESAFVRDGGLMSFGPSYPDMYRRAAGYVAKILGGRKPADLPVEQPIKFEMTVNLQTAKGLGLTIPPTLLARADEVIE